MYISKEPNRKTSILAEADEEKFKKTKLHQSSRELSDSEEKNENFEAEETEEQEIINPASVIYKWRAPEHEVTEKDKRWYLWIGLILSGIVIYAILTDSLVMAITFILIGMVGYIIVNKTPRIVNFYITDDGVIADKEIYEFENIKSFWIFYEEEGPMVVSLYLKSKIMPFAHIPLGDEDPTVIREILMRYIEEVKQKPSAVDNFERFLGL